ncbi:MAG: gluconate 2-dehydrogenase subunit 3 family protein, partial [Halobacteriaceae archaeon]
MELTRRDLITAITATTAIAGFSELDDILASSEALNAHQIDTIIAVARVVYPSDLDNIDTFVKKYSIARISDRPQYKGNVQTAIRSLDTY